MDTDAGTGVTDVLREGRRRRARPDWLLLAVIAAGGVVGSLGRYGFSLAVPATADGFPWATFIVNAGGCLFIGILMMLVAEVSSPHRLLRPFLGVGLLGGFTTFSAFTVDVQRLLVGGVADVAFVYLAGTLVAALAATAAGVSLARALTGTRHRWKGSPR